MNATTAAIITASLTPTLVTPTIFGFNPFEFWAMIIGAMSAIFGFILAVFAFVLGLQIWQQIKLRNKAEKEYEAIKKVAKDMTTLRNEHKKLLTALIQTTQEQAKDVVNKAKEVTAIKETSQEAKQKIETITREIETKAEDLRGSVIQLGNVSSLGTISGPTLSGINQFYSTQPLKVGRIVSGAKMRVEDIPDFPVLTNTEEKEE